MRKGQTKEDVAIDEILDTYAGWVKQKYKIYPIGTSVSMPEGVLKFMGVEFQSYRVISKQEAREIIIDSIQKLLSMINSDDRLQDCLIVRPFWIKNVVMKIFIKDARGASVFDPNIRVIRFSNGCLEYLTSNEFDEYVSDIEESYEDAIKALNEKND